MTTTTPRHYLSAPEAAALIGVTPGHIRNLNSAGQMPPPDATIGQVPGWEADTIRGWHAQRTREGRVRRTNT